MLTKKSTKKSKKPKVKLESEDYHQALDYAYVMMVAYYEMLSKCEVVKQNKFVNEAFSKAGEAMANLYQTIAQQDCAPADE